MSRTAQRIREDAAAAEAQLLAIATAPAETADVADNDPPADDAVVTDPAPAPAPPPPQPSALERDYAELKHRYDTLQGMFARQGADHQQLQAQLQTLSARMEALSSQTPPAAPPSPTSTKVTKQDREEYGDALIDLIYRVASDATAIKFQTLDARLNRLEKGLGETNQKATTAAKIAEETAAERFYRELTKIHADWEAVNESQEWLTWLAVRDPIAGVRRDVLLQDAHKNLDVERTAAFFTAFKSDTGKSGTASGGAKSGEPRIDPKTIVSPTSAASGQPVGQPPANRGKTFTTADLDKLYADRVKGKISEAEFKQREAEIHMAAAQGRFQI